MLSCKTTLLFSSYFMALLTVLSLSFRSSKDLYATLPISQQTTLSRKLKICEIKPQSFKTAIFLLFLDEISLCSVETS